MSDTQTPDRANALVHERLERATEQCDTLHQRSRSKSILDVQYLGNHFQRSTREIDGKFALRRVDRRRGCRGNMLGVVHCSSRTARLVYDGDDVHDLLVCVYEHDARSR